MFEIDENSLPFVRTHQALLILDLQNDFISTGGKLAVETPSDFVEKILGLVPEFRASDYNIIWIRSVFEASRPINAAAGEGESESVITDKELPSKLRGADEHLRRRAKPSKKLVEAHGKIAEANGRPLESDSELLPGEEEEDAKVQETFLTLREGQKPFAVAAASPGTNFSQAAIRCIDGKKDLVFEKSWYSAFKDGRLVQILRAKFVTEIYLCGALTNISVFATAMDAARYGYSITIVEDCLGYRSKERHDEAMRKLMDFTGCDIVNSEELIDQIRQKSKRKPAATNRAPRRRSGQRVAGLENMMAHLNLKPDGSSAHLQPPANSTGAPTKVAAGAETVGNPVSSKSDYPETESQETEFPIRPAEAKRERVKNKVKTRRRHSKSAPKDTGVVAGPSNERSHMSPTAATLEAASQALEKLPKPDSAEENSMAVSASDTPSINTGSEKAAMKPHSTGNGTSLSPDQQVEMEKKASPKAGLNPLCEGDTAIINDLLDADIATDIFEKIRDEVRWQKMSHQGGDVPRLVAVQGEIAEDGSIPIYRHPADESPPLLPFSTTVSLIKAEAEKKLGHSVNHVLIQYYRDGTDYISEHSDKTLDIVPRTFIANVSLGAQRTMVFRTKKPEKTEASSSEPGPPRQACRAPLPHNSLCKMGLVTNMRWLHGIRQDKRMKSEKTKEELAFDGGRISLTFRSIGTFLDKNQHKIWGQGAVAKTKDEARTVINGDTAESERMIRAFGQENHSSNFDWKESYGEGFDVLHIFNSPKLFLSGDFVADTRVKILLAEFDVHWSEASISLSFNWKEGNTSSNHEPEIPESLPVKFVDNDLSKSTVVGDIAIMLYLNPVYGADSLPKSQAELARVLTRLQQCEEISKKRSAVPFNAKILRRELELWQAYAKEGMYIAGDNISVADWALWPVLHEVRDELGAEGLETLRAYYERMKERGSIVKALGEEKGKALDPREDVEKTLESPARNYDEV